MGAAAFAGTGNSLANTIRGAAGADILDGKAGADILIGGAGNDTYLVDDLADVVTEAVNQGTDLIKTALSAYALTNIANVENLTFIGTGDFAGTGNGLANIITGGAGNDILDGGAGADTLIGGAGNDIYVADNAADVVTEAAGVGIDEIQTSLATYSIAALVNVENLTYTGTGNFAGTGNALANTITGGDGDDTLNGGAGADTLIGGMGNDTYIVDSAGDAVTENVDEGIDTVRTALAVYTIASSGNVENLTYTGTAAFRGTGNGLDNVLIGGAAADSLSGGAGNDTLIGGAGSDAMSGGVGDDTYVVDVATDIVIENPEEGTDTVKTALASYSLAPTASVENLTYTGIAAFTGVGNAAVNVIIGGVGNDTLDGSAGADTLIGRGGNDTYIVDDLGDLLVEAENGGTDTVKTALTSYSLASAASVENLTFTGTGGFAGAGNSLDNAITGGVGNDTLSGDAGNDRLNGGAGADALSGGTGNDIYVVDNAGDTVTENADEGTDTVQANLASYTLGANVENLTNIGATAFAGTGNTLDNVLTGGAGVDTLKGGAGDDTYVISTGDIVLENADEGTDTVKTGLAAYTLAANVENVTYLGTVAFTGTGNALDNIIRGGAAPDRLAGAAGNDTLDGGAGADAMIGGSGDDVYIVDIVTDVVTEAANGGTDTVKTGLAGLTLAANVEILTYTGTAAFAGMGNDLANTITGGAGNDTLNGGAGADALIGGMGNDTYIVDSAADVVTENADEGIDTVKTTLAVYTIGSDVENLTYTGTAAFSGTGNNLANTIRGAAGADMLDGEAGADILIGGAGDDTYFVDDLGDVVTELVNQGTDRVRTALSAYALTNIANVENLTFIGTGDFAGTGNALSNWITGGAGNDILNGGAGADMLIGWAGNDVYIVDIATDLVVEAKNEGTDTVKTGIAGLTLAANVENLVYTGMAGFTGTGNDLANTISGGAGNDTLDGEAGADTLIGGMGNDIYIVDSAGDVISESANEGIDTVKTTLAAYMIGSEIENLAFIGTGAFTGTGNGLNNTITGGVAADTLSGGDGDDTLDGKAGADTLIGSAGNDTYIVDNAGDVIAESADEGIDTVKTTLASYTIASNVENLTYTGTGNFTGIGNALSNTITAGNGNDTLNGGTGADTLIGGAGNDYYVVDNTGVVVIEKANAGVDLVQTSLANYALGENIEDLRAVGDPTVAFVGTGNALNNRIEGNLGASNTLTGGAGDDRLWGGTAADFFVYSPNWGHDMIENFVATGAQHDTIRIDHTIFADWASLLAASHLSGSSTIITADANNTITLWNVAVSSLQSADFQFV
ncbi:Ca2+-binding RTX toxin-like protein [Rhizobium sp. BK060]|nr:Ca2+-binding RTX toxin-like protein [Rhizobium sp. BK060]